VAAHIIRPALLLTRCSVLRAAVRDDYIVRNLERRWASGATTTRSDTAAVLRALGLGAAPIAR
jgi:hypothetical protein